MKFSRLIAIGFTLVISANSFAVISSTIPLDSETAPAGQNITLSLDKLYSNVAYDISCMIRNNNSNAEKESNIRLDIFRGPYYGYAYIDEAIVGTKTVVSFKSTGSHLQFSNVTKSNAYAIIQNLDATDSISILNCAAILRK